MYVDFLPQGIWKIAMDEGAKVDALMGAIEAL
jgi:hypothetical protein